MNTEEVELLTFSMLQAKSADDNFWAAKIVFFVCVEVLRPSQPTRVMSSVVSLSNHTFTGQAVL